MQIILAEIHAEGMVLSETFQVASIIEKLPHGWKDFKNYLKHKRKEMSIEDLGSQQNSNHSNKSASGGYFTLDDISLNQCGNKFLEFKAWIKI